jgi:dipeptidyl aminopeptidase/acylaminoacyl peptidase
MAAAVVLISLHATAAPLPVDVYGLLPVVSDVVISADGEKIGMAKSAEGRASVVVADRSGKGVSRQYNFGEGKIRDIEWSGPNHLLVYVSKVINVIELQGAPRVDYCGVFSIDVRNSTEPKQLLGSSENLAFQMSLCSVESVLWTDKGEVLMSARMKEMSDRAKRGGSVEGVEALVRVNGETGRGNVIARGGQQTAAWVTSTKGHVLARIDYTYNTDRYSVLVPTSEDRLGNWKTVFKDETERPSITVFGMNAAEDALIISTRLKTGMRGLFELRLADGVIGAPLFESDGVDVTRVIKDPYTSAIIGAGYTKDYPEQIFFQNDMQAVLTAARGALPGWASVRIESWDRARQTFAVFAQGHQSAGEYFIIDRSKGRIELLARQRPSIKTEHMANVTGFTFAARDGLKLPAYLTTPPHVAAKNLPLVVMPHGGPAARNDMSFDYWAQALATRGYAVLQVNFRGSSGYGDAFEAAGEGEWGGKMQDDLTDGVAHVIAQGVADPAKVCIVGASYGGFAAMAGAAFTPEVYKCAVSVNGVTDLRSFMNWVAGRYGAEGTTYEALRRSIGNPKENVEKINARSPARNAANITADVLLIHGEDDTTVPVSQSEQMRDALKAAGKPVQFIRLDGEDHYLSRSKTRTEMLNALDAFLAKHLGGAASVQAAEN